MDTKEETSDSVPIDLLIDILSRLPAKSIARFCCVSKLWDSMLHSSYLTDLFLTWSRGRPCTIFVLQTSTGWSFYSLPQLQNPIFTTDFHIKLPRGLHNSTRWSYATGLIYFSDIRYQQSFYSNKIVIINPSTRQYTIIPKCNPSTFSRNFLGFDPIDKQFKILSIAYPRFHGHRILTLGTGEVVWREIQCPLPHYPSPKGICIDGVLYYQADASSHMIVCFDIRSEKFKFIHTESDWDYSYLIKYKGKVGVIGWDYHDAAIELHLWDAEKNEWLKYTYTLPDNKFIDRDFRYSVVGVIATGEIVLSKAYISKQSFYLIYFNPERNTLQHVFIPGLYGTVHAFVDHVEDLNVNYAKLLK